MIEFYPYVKYVIFITINQLVMKIQITESQYRALVEQSNRWWEIIKSEVFDIQNYIKDINWDVMDTAVLNGISREDMTLLIMAYKKFKGGVGNGAPNINPLLTQDGDKIGTVNGSNWYKCGRFGNPQRQHNGVDLDTQDIAKNQPAVAACNGTITASEYGVGNCGGMIKLKCKNGYTAQYCHMDFVFPAEIIVGQQVPQGFPIGVTGGDNPNHDKEGGSSGAHLHYAIFKDGYSWNPYYLPFTKSLEFAQGSGDEPIKMKLCRCSKSKPECCCKKK
jgi:murein DD-endopeptidase MepM/ murein hydrolase activator NlpD